MRGEIDQQKGMLGAMELTREQLDALYDLTVVSDDGHTMGPVGHIYLDDETQRATWITAKTGLFGFRQVFIPFQGARIEPDTIKVRYTKDYILDAPRFETDGHISETEQDELFAYFGLRRPAGPPADAPSAWTDAEVGAPVTEAPVPAGVDPQEAVAEVDEVSSHGALVDPVATEDPLAQHEETSTGPASPADGVGDVTEPAQAEPGAGSVPAVTEGADAEHVDGEPDGVHADDGATQTDDDAVAVDDNAVAADDDSAADGGELAGSENDAVDPENDPVDLEDGAPEPDDPGPEPTGDRA